MRGIVVRRRSLVDDVLRWLSPGVLGQFAQWWRGPVASADIGAGGLGEVTGARWLRPVDLKVAPEAMLTMRLAIPTAARHELPHAVALAIRQDTPFEPHELLVQAVEIERGAGSESYLVHAVPKRLVDDAVRRVGHIRLGRIHVGEGAPDLGGAMFPWRRARPWLALLPLTVMFGVAATGAHGLLADQDQKAALLEAQVATALAELRQLSGELDTIETETALANQIAAGIAATPAAFLMLERARGALPPATEVVQVELRAGELRLSLRSGDALADMARFTEAGWSATIDGAITADPPSGREIAVLRLSQATGPR